MCIGLLISCPLPTCSEQLSINGAVPASFVALVWGICFCDCGECEAWKSDNPYDGSYSPVVVAAAARVFF